MRLAGGLLPGQHTEFEFFGRADVRCGSWPRKKRPSQGVGEVRSQATIAAISGLIPTMTAVTAACRMGPRLSRPTFAGVTGEPSVGLFYLGENPWNEIAFRTVAAALAKLMEQPAG